jgi:hypothetical protein
MVVRRCVALTQKVAMRQVCRYCVNADANSNSLMANVNFIITAGLCLCMIEAATKKCKHNNNKK